MRKRSASVPPKGIAHFPARAGRVSAWFALPIVLAAGAFWYWFDQSGAGPLWRGAADEAPIVTVPRIDTVGYGSVTNVVSAAGRVEAREIVPVPARASGELIELLVEVGDRVVQDQALALIDPTELRLRVELRELDLERLTIQVPQFHMELETAQTAARRVEAAMTDDPDSAGPQAEIDRARNAVQSAQTALQSLLVQIRQNEVLLEEARRELSHSEVRAPIDGTVMALEQRKGAILVAGPSVTSAPLLARLADLTALTVVAEVSEADVEALDEGTEAYLSTLRGGDRLWAGAVDRIDPRPARAGEDPFYTVRFEVDNADGLLFPGMTAQVYFVTSSVENILIVPLAALRFADVPGARDATVQLVLPDDTVTDRDVVVGLRDRVNAEVVSGLEEGDRVVAGAIQI